MSLTVMMQLKETFTPTFYKKPEFYYRAMNLGIATFEFYHLLTNPSSLRALELVPDIMIHAIEATFPNSMNNIMTGANSYRFLHAGYACISHNTTIPLYANLLDTHFHAYTLWRRLNNVLNEDDARTKEKNVSEQDEADECLCCPRNLITQFARTVTGRKPIPIWEKQELSNKQKQKM